MLVLTLVNVVFSWSPRAVIAVIAATAISAAIRPYSMAVAPRLSRKMRMNFCIGTFLEWLLVPPWSSQRAIKVM